MSLTDWIIQGSILLLFFIRLYFYFLQIKLIKFNYQALKKSYTPPVSVIIAAKNEAENLQKFLRGILEQDYPSYEVIVVNDRSTDNTGYILDELKKRYKHLRTTYIKPGYFKHGKKLALTIGIKAAKYKYLVFTDADCKVVSNQWLKLIARNFKKGSLILGYGGYRQQPSFLNKLIRYDAIYIAILYFSKALSGKPYMGVGRNLAYAKMLYDKVKGFSSHYHVSTGDDDLFVNESSSFATTVIETHPNSFTFSVPPHSFKSWQRQKGRHLLGSKYYSLKQKVFLALENFSRGIFYFLSITAIIFFPHILFPVIVILLFDLIIKYVVSGNLFRHFGGKDLIPFSILFDFISTFLIFVRLIINIFANRKYGNRL